MNAFQPCPNMSDSVPLYLPQQLYLKPIARINISLQLPNVKKLGKSVSHWEIMDKIRELIKPEEFTLLKVTKTTVEFVRFEAEIETKSKVERAVSKLDNKMIKLKDFSELMRVRACEWKSDFPNRRIWDDFFHDAKDMDEMKAGERPDTIHIWNIPRKWVIPYHLSGEDMIPSEKIFYRIFEKFGSIRYVDIPICDPYRKKMKDHISGLKHTSFDNMDFFEGYVQFKDYIGFTKAMDALRDKKLVHKDNGDAIEVNIKVDFDRSKHLSDASIRRRDIVREHLVKKAREKEEKERAKIEEKIRKEELERQRELDLKVQKEMRRKLREEKRKAKILQKLEINGTDEINEKIAKEEKKLLKVQRKLEAIRLVEELFRRIKEKHPDNVQLYHGVINPAHEELRKFKNTSELEVLTQREKLHHAVKGRMILKSILSNSVKSKQNSASSSDSSLSPEEVPSEKQPQSRVLQKYPELLYEPTWMNYPYPLPTEYVDPFIMRGYIPRGRAPFPRFSPVPGPSRGAVYNRRRGNYYHRLRGVYRGARNRLYPPELEEEYQKYFAKFLNENGRERRSRSYSPRSRYRDSRSRSRRCDHSTSRTRSRSRRRSRSYGSRYSRSSSRSRRKSSSRDRSRSKSSRKSSRKRRRSRSKSMSRSKEKSVDSTKFITPKELAQQMSERQERSRSWSMPKGDEQSKRSWSKSPEKKD